MTPRRGDLAEERRDGESMELGGNIYSIEEKLGALDEKVSSLDERLTALDAKLEKSFGSLEALIRNSRGTQAQENNAKEKGKGSIPNPNPKIFHEERGETLEELGNQPLLVNGNLIVPQGGGGEVTGQGDRGGRQHAWNPRQGRPWARGGGWGAGREVGGPRQGLPWANWGLDRGGPQGGYPRGRRSWAGEGRGGYRQGGRHPREVVGRERGEPRARGPRVEWEKDRNGPEKGDWHGEELWDEMGPEGGVLWPTHGRGRRLWGRDGGLWGKMGGRKGGRWEDGTGSRKEIEEIKNTNLRRGKRLRVDLPHRAVFHGEPHQ